MNSQGASEDRLLELIRTGKHTLDEITEQPFYLAKIAGRMQRMIPRIDWAIWLNWCVRGLLITAIVLVVLTIALPRPVFAPANRVAGSDAADTVASQHVVGEGFEADLAAVRASNVFGLPAVKATDLSAQADEGLNAYALVGILVEDPVQAILKNKKSGEVFYLKQGDSLGDIRVAEILEGKIIVEYRQERFEIHL